MKAKRWAPEEPFPAYSYVPGLFPHPISDPQGHSFGRTPRERAEDSEGSIFENRSMRVGVDLFNHGYYWEAHEAWEQLWIALERRGPSANLVQGLIKLAAAGVKARQGSREGVRRHARRAVELLRVGAEALKPEKAINAWELIAAAQALADAPDPVLGRSSEPVVVVFDFWVELCPVS